MSNIVWLASYPKSGNTWVRVFLMHLLANAEQPLGLDDFMRLGAGESTEEIWKKVCGKSFTELDWKAINENRPKVHMAVSRSGPAPLFVKTHNVLGDIHGIPLITPEATWGAIYIIRNPLDVAPAAAHHFGTDIDKTIQIMANEQQIASQEGKLPQVLSSWSNHVKSWTVRPSPRLFVVRYEDLLEKPTESFGKMAEFLQINRTADELARAIEFSSFDRLKQEEQEKGFKESSPRAKDQFFRSGKAGGWRDVLTKEQAEAIVRDHAEQMQRFGYLTLRPAAGQPAGGTAPGPLGAN